MGSEVHGSFPPSSVQHVQALLSAPDKWPETTGAGKVSIGWVVRTDTTEICCPQ